MVHSVLVVQEVREAQKTVCYTNVPEKHHSRPDTEDHAVESINKATARCGRTSEHTRTPAAGKQGQEDCEFKVILGYHGKFEASLGSLRPCLKNNLV